MISSEPLLLISLKPRDADLIFEGVKRVELRRHDLRHVKGRRAYVYVTRPAMELQGGFRVGEVLTGPPQQIWDAVSTDGGIIKADFDAYYAGCEVACALRIVDAWKFAYPKSLTALRQRFENFVVPQSWRYARPQEYRSFRNMKKRATPTSLDGRRPQRALMRPRS